MMDQALEQAQQSIRAAGEGSIGESMRAAKRSARLALAATYEDSITAQTYFSYEFKYAVYLPIFLPMFLPIFSATYREVKRWKKERKKARQGAGHEAVEERKDE